MVNGKRRLQSTEDLIRKRGKFNFLRGWNFFFFLIIHETFSLIIPFEFPLYLQYIAVGMYVSFAEKKSSFLSKRKYFFSVLINIKLTL